MTERPILFSAPMVRAILAGSKTQTRRVAPVEHLSIREIGGGVCWEAKFSKPVRSRVSGGMAIGTYSGGPFTPEQAASIVAADFCPYGKPGDRLWVRETWAPQVDCELSAERWTRGINCSGPKPIVHFAADDGRSVKPWVTKWRPSIHMPRWACRLELEVTGVRVERLQAISEADALAEGVESWAAGACAKGNPYGLTPDGYFELLWSSINGRDSWDADPWVWVVEFARVA